MKDQLGLKLEPAKVPLWRFQWWIMWNCLRRTKEGRDCGRRWGRRRSGILLGYRPSRDEVPHLDAGGAGLRLSSFQRPPRTPPNGLWQAPGPRRASVSTGAGLPRARDWTTDFRSAPPSMLIVLLDTINRPNERDQPPRLFCGEISDQMIHTVTCPEECIGSVRIVVRLIMSHPGTG